MAEASDKSDETHEQNSEDDLPQHILEKYDSGQQVQLIKGYRILQVLLYYPNNKVFFEKPEDETVGTKRYFEIIKQPMWLHEIKRKFFNAEYNSLTEVIKDMRLIFENCYYFWGPKASISQQCLQMEKQFESQILLLPKDLKILCTLEKSHGNNDETVNRIWNRCKNRVKTCSNLMLRTWRKRRLREGAIHESKSDLATLCKRSEQITAWEKENFPLSEDSSSVFSMQELPEIGLFSMLVQDLFGLEPFCQIEIERQFFMARFSSLFKRLLIVFLDVDKTDEELLTNEALLKKLEERVAEWYKKFSIVCDHDEKVKSLQSIGVDLDFFEAVGQENPLENVKYDDLSYYQKVVIFRTLCDNVVQCRSDIKEVVLNAGKENSLVQKLGSDKDGYTYLYCNTFKDFRLYKLKMKETNEEPPKEETKNETDAIPDRSPIKRLFGGGGTDCELVADSIEKMRRVVDELFYGELKSSKKDGKVSNVELIQTLLDLDAKLYSREAEFIQLRNQFRIRFYNEWIKASGASDDPVLEDVSDVENEDKYVENEAADVKDEAYYEEGSHQSGENEKGDDEKNYVYQDVYMGGGGEEEESGNGDGFEDDTNDDVKPKDANESSGESSQSRKHRKRKKSKKKKKKRKRHKHEYESPPHKPNKSEKLHEVFIEENVGDDAVKAQLVIDEEKSDSVAKDSETDETKNEGDGNSGNSEDAASSTSSRRRRSSVQSYNEYGHAQFSDDEVEAGSAEEVFSTDDDSDADWEIPRKRARNKKTNSNKPVKSDGGSFCSFGRRTKHFMEDGQPISEQRSKPASDAEQTPAADAADSVTEMTEVMIKEEIKTETCGEESQKKSEPAKSEKPTQKIKVMDFAKLNNAAGVPNPVIRTLRPVENSGSFIISQPNTMVNNSLPIIQSMFSGPPVVGNAFLIRSLQQPVQYNMTAGSMPTMPRFAAVSNMNSPRVPRIVRAQSMNPAYSNSTATLKPIPGMTPLNQAYFGPNTSRRQNVQYERVMRSNPPISRKVTVTPKTVQRNLSVREIEGMIGLHSGSDGLQYVVNLANGSHVPLSNEQVQKLRDGNDGVLPQKLKIPVPADVAEKIEPCVVIDD